jgi:peptidoglycan/LPS O-acetylase OafA/YrhL
MSGMFLYRPFVKMTLAGAPKPALGQFFLRRGARLLPAFWLLTAFCLLVLNFSSIDGLWYVLRPFLLMEIYDHQWYAGMDVVWTVPTEVQFYIALPILAWLGHRFARGATDPARKARRLLYPLGVLVVVQLAWTVYVHGSFEMWPPEYYYPFGVAGLFAIGMAMAIWNVLAEVAPDKEPRFFGLARRRPNMFWIGALAMWAINCFQPFAVAGTADWIGPEAAVIRSTLLLSFSFLIMVPLVVPNATSRVMTALLGGRVIRYLGSISYGIYLWHFAVMYLVFGSGSIFGEIIPVHLLIGKFGYWELVVPVVLGTVLAASVSYYVLERPIIRLVERRVKRKQAPPTVHTHTPETPQDPGIAKAA